MVGRAAEAQGAAVGRPDAKQELGERRLARAARADDGRVLAARDAEGETLKDALTLAVGEREVLCFKEWRLACRICIAERCLRWCGNPLWLACLFIRRRCLANLPLWQEMGGQQAAAALPHGFGQGAEFDEQGLQHEEVDAEVDAAECSLGDAQDQEGEQGHQHGGVEQVLGGIAFGIAARELQRALQKAVCWPSEALEGGGTARAYEFVGTACGVQEGAAVVGVARALPFFARLTAGAGEHEPREVERGQGEGPEADDASEQPGGQRGDRADGGDGQQRADVEVAQLIGARQEVVQELALASGAAAKRQDLGGPVVERRADLGQDAEGHAVREVALAVTEDGAADAAGPHGGDAERERVERRHQGGRGHEPGRGAEQREAREERHEAHEQHGQELQ